MRSRSLEYFSLFDLVLDINSYLLTPWSRVFLEKLIGVQLDKKYPRFVETEGSLPHSQVPATCPYHKLARSILYPTSHFLKIHFNIILPSTPGSPKWSLSLRFRHQILYTPLLSPIRYRNSIARI